jgi:hypothetical protein
VTRAKPGTVAPRRQPGAWGRYRPRLGPPVAATVVRRVTRSRGGGLVVWIRVGVVVRLETHPSRRASAQATARNPVRERTRKPCRGLRVGGRTPPGDAASHHGSPPPRTRVPHTGCGHPAAHRRGPARPPIPAPGVPAGSRHPPCAVAGRRPGRPEPPPARYGPTSGVAGCGHPPGTARPCQHGTRHPTGGTGPGSPVPRGGPGLRGRGGSGVGNRGRQAGRQSAGRMAAGRAAGYHTANPQVSWDAMGARPARHPLLGISRGPQRTTTDQHARTGRTAVPAPVASPAAGTVTSPAARTAGRP